MLNLLKILRKVMLVLSLLFSFFIFNFTSLAMNTTYSIKALDTIKGNETYFSVEGADDFSLKLFTPSGRVYFIGDLELNKIPDLYLNEIGGYDIYLLTEYAGISNVIVAKDEFEVKPKSSFLKASSFGFGGDSDRFEFLGVPEEVQVGETFNFTLKALSEDLEVNLDYIGEVSFMSTDAAAELPSNYTFLESEAGVHVFSGLSTFLTPGDQTISVVDTDDSSLLGEITLTVTGDTSEATESNTEGTMEISSPVIGTTNENIIRFAGTVDPGLEVKVYTDGELLTVSNADSEGNFDFNSPVMADGDYLFTLETTTAKSQVIEITIDASADILNNFTFSNEDPKPGEKFTLDINLSDSISAARVLLDEKYTDLINADLILAKSFTGELTAPSEPGEYPVDLLIILPSGEEVLIEDLALLVLEDSFHASETDSINDTFFVPSKVTGISGTASDKAVTLSWNPATDNTGVSNYLIKYGTDLNNLSLSVVTNGSETIWYIPDLNNDQTYYFQIYGVDTEGNLSDQASDIISISPGVEGQTTVHGTEEGQILVETTSETGPEIYYLFLLSCFIAYQYKILRSEF